jgi:dTDP-4-amino-4,6-dideoxygalactose transaminase
MTPVPFNRPMMAGGELENMAQTVAAGHLSGDGGFTARCQALLEHLIEAPKVLLTTSCTHAQEMAALLLDIRTGDEVIVPSYTFVSTVNAFVLRGATPIFADIRPDTLNLDETQISGLITPRTRAIVAVHYGGVACALDEIVAIADRNRLALIEDNAHGLFGRYRGRPLGSWGTMSTLSFHETKNVTCGEGGALVLKNVSDVGRAEVIRDKGTNRSQFLRGEIDKYTWVDVGSSYLPADILAAFLLAQLQARERVQARRQTLWQRYACELRDWAAAAEARLPIVPAECEHPYHLFYLLLPSHATRQALIDHLKTREIQAVPHYRPLHISEMGRRFGGREGQCPISENVCDRLLRLPLSNGLTDDEQDRVIAAVVEHS